MLTRSLMLLVLCFLWACDDGGASSGALNERDAAEDQVCRFNSDCAPGYFCKDRRCDLECRTSRDCPLGQSCESGECLGIGPDVGVAACQSDDACSPPDTVCAAGVCVPGCIESSCAEGRVCRAGHCEAFDCRVHGCEASETCAPSGVCQPADLCDPPCADDERCDADLRRCVLLPPDCVAGGCDAGERCNPDSGDCEPAVFDCNETPCEVGQVCERGTGQCRAYDCALDGCPEGQRCEARGCVPDGPRREALGGPCEVAAHCASDMCFSEPQNPNQGFCSALCCSENDCPAGFGCMYYAGVRACFPARLFPTNNFSTPAGGACGAVNDCRTGICGQGRCLDSCCTDRDCLGAVCEILPTGAGSARSVCDRGNLLGGFDYSPCYTELDCVNRLCVFNPEAQQGQPPGFCAPTCCTHADCGGQLGCGQIAVGQGNSQFVLTGCAPMTRGAVADNAACLNSEECASGHCVEAACRNPCCRDQDCGGGLRCLPRANGEGTLIRVCVTPNQAD
jgi:hypothetical protein